MVVTGADAQDLHRQRWPMEWQRPNVTARGETWVDLQGFADVYGSGGSVAGSEKSPSPLGMTDRRFLVAFPPLNGTARRVGLTDSVVDSTCSATETCPLYPARFVHQTTTLARGQTEHFVSVLAPHGPDEDAAQMAGSMQAAIEERGEGVYVATVSLKVGGAEVTATLQGADESRGAPTSWSVDR